MSMVVRNEISYSGIDEYIPTEINSFTQRNVDKLLVINEDLPDIDEIIKVNIKSNIKNNKIVNTAIGKSYEGQKLTGIKLLSEGEFIVRIDYCSETENGCIYTFKDTFYFNNATTLPENRSDNTRIIESIYVEDIYAQKINERELIVNISFIFAIENY